MERVEWLNGMRALACIMVIWIHVSAQVVLMDIDTDGWAFANVVDSFSRASVPLFFMISGFLFFREKSPRARNFVRLLLAFGFYSAIALIVRAVAGQDINPASIIFGKPAYYHLWFFYPLFILYLLAFIIRIRGAGWLHLLAIAALMLPFNPMVPGLMGASEGKNIFSITPGIFHYLLFGLFGAVAGQMIEDGRFPRISVPAAWIVFMATSSLIAILTSEASVSKGSFDGRFYSYTGVLVIIAAMSLFVAAAAFFTQVGHQGGILGVIASASLVVYGLHAIFLDILKPYVFALAGTGILGQVALFSLTLCTSLLAFGVISRLDRRRLLS